ncbi:MAG: hypothetical protein IT178_00675 [Acidobacteria bacterium]|nr:hypothetical protein [Acidobacteriota bacterium]
MPPIAIWLLSWLVPGAGHLIQTRVQKGVIFFIAIPAMFVIGLMLKGRLFPFDFTQPLVGLAALATLATGVPYFVASMLGLGQGVVTDVAYEYGNAFLIVAGLLNMLVALDAYDVRMGRK